MVFGDLRSTTVLGHVNGQAEIVGGDDRPLVSPCQHRRDGARAGHRSAANQQDSWKRHGTIDCRSARDRSRTDTLFRAEDFESPASAIPPPGPVVANFVISYSSST